MSTITDGQVEAALARWFDDGSAWTRQMTPEVRQAMRASMRAALEAAEGVRETKPEPQDDLPTASDVRGIPAAPKENGHD